MDRATYTIEEAARILGIGRSSAYQAVRIGEIPTIRIGRRFLVPKAALELMLNLGNNNVEPAQRSETTIRDRQG